MERIHVSANKRFLETESGKPFFWLGDTAWELFHRMNITDVNWYFDQRAAQGYTVIQAVVLAEEDGLHTPNVYGQTPLLNDDPATPNERYFEYVDTIIDAAQKRGLYIGLLPTWGDKVNLQWGVGPVIFNPENAYYYGQWLGKRYSKTTNIIWILGGDRNEVTDGIDYAPIWRAMAKGIKDGVSGHTLMTYHPTGGRGSSEPFHQDDWLDLNMWQSGHSGTDLPNWEYITEDYNKTPNKPVLDGEPGYEDHPIDPYRQRKWKVEYGRFQDYDIRKQAYRAVFAGACGHTYGHHSIWQCYEPPRKPKTFAYPDWRTAVHRPGAWQMQFLKNLMLSRPYFNRIPDQSLLTSDQGEGPAHIRATRAENGSYALIYCPLAAQALQVDGNKLEGDMINAWWLDPRTGQTELIGQFSKSILNFTTPEIGLDWVLVLDDAAQGFPPPGIEK